MDNKDIEKNFEIIAEKIENGEELTKLIINNYIIHSDLSEKEKLKLALKYQIFTKETSLFAEVELSNKISEKMKLEILGDKENNIFKKVIQKKEPMIYNNILDYDCNAIEKDLCIIKNNFRRDCKIITPIKVKNNTLVVDKNVEIVHSYKSQKKALNSSHYRRFSKEPENKIAVNCASECNVKSIIMKKSESNSKDSIMKMINTQDFIEGSWEENEYTKKIIEKYKKEYELLKGLKNKNMNDKIALTILIIYYINKDHSHLLNDLTMIMKKAKLFIHKNTNDNYENLIKAVGLN